MDKWTFLAVYLGSLAPLFILGLGSVAHQFME